MLPPFANTTKNSEIAIITSGSKVIQITVAPFANTTTTSQTTLMTLTTQGAEVRPANRACPLAGRCPNLTQNRRGYVFGDSVISQRMIAFNNDAPALCKPLSEKLFNDAANFTRGDAQNGCVAYQIGPVRRVTSQGLINSNSGAPRANSQGSAGNTFGVAGGSGQGSVPPNAATEDLMMVMVNLLNSSPGDSFDQAATNDDLGTSYEFVIYDHVCAVSGIVCQISPSSPSTSAS